jgi:hypothetical protein
VVSVLVAPGAGARGRLCWTCRAVGIVKRKRRSGKNCCCGGQFARRCIALCVRLCDFRSPVGRGRRELCDTRDIRLLR